MCSYRRLKFKLIFQKRYLPSLSINIPIEWLRKFRKCRGRGHAGILHTIPLNVQCTDRSSLSLIIS